MRIRRNSGRRSEGRKNERGTELVEITLVLPLLIFLVMGMLDAGVAWKTKLEVVQATRQGARIGSAFGDDEFADQEAVLAAMSVIPGYVNLDPADTTSPRLDYIILYRADAANGEPTAACQTGTVANLCLHLSRADIEAFLINHSGSPATNHLSGGWQVRPDQPELLESLGVYIAATQPSFTGVFESLQTWNVTGKTVMRTEPLID